MTRDAAYQILTKYLSNPVLIKHSLATEATMRALAQRFKENVDDWGITGLLHDADYDKAKGQPEKHGILLFKLEPNTIPSYIERAIQSHNEEFTHVAPVARMDWAIICCDELTGIIVDIASRQKEKKLSSVTTDTVVQKLKQKNYPHGVNKKFIFQCEDKLDLSLEEFVGITLKAMQDIHEELGL